MTKKSRRAQESDQSASGPYKPEDAEGLQLMLKGLQ